MFKLVTAVERVAVEAGLFGLNRKAIYSHALSEQVSGRVVRDVGMVIGVWEILSVHGETLQASCGRAVATVVFRLVVFAPFRGEVVPAIVGGASPSCLLLAIPFFGALRVPPSALPPGTNWDDTERVWVWDEPTSGIKLYIDLCGHVVARVTEVGYKSTASTGSTREMSEQPMAITATLHDKGENAQGLGDPSWWYEEEQDDVEEDEGEEEAMEEDE